MNTKNTPSKLVNIIFNRFALTAALCLTASVAQAVDGSWVLDVSSGWSTPANWSSNPSIPGGIASTVGLNNNIGANRAVNIDGTPRTVGILSIGDSVGTSAFTLAASGGGTLTFDNTGVGNAQVNFSGGANIISAPVVLGTSLDIVNSVASTQTISGAISASGGTKTITNSGSAGDVALSGAITGSVAITQNSSGTLGLTNKLNAFTGDVTLASGRLSMGFEGGLGSGTLRLNGGTFFRPGTTGGATYTNAVSIGGNASIVDGSYVGVQGRMTFSGPVGLGASLRDLTISSAASTSEIAPSVIFSGVVSGVGGGIHKLGAGELSLSGTNTFTGGVQVSAGTLIASKAVALPGYNTAGKVVIDGGTLGVGISGAGWTTAQVDTLLTNATKTSGALGIDYAGTQWTAFTTTNFGSALGLTKFGTSTLTLNQVNTYTGATTISTGGILNTTKATALSQYNVANKVIFNGGTLGVQVGGAGWTTTEVDTALANATKTSGALGIDTTNGNLTQWTAFTTTNFGSTLGLTKLGTNALTLNQANTYNGATTLSAGTVNVNHTSALGSASSTITLNNGLILDNTSGAALTLANNQTISIGSSNLTYSTSAGTALNNLNLGTGTVTIGANKTIILNGAGALTFGGVLTNVTTGGWTLTVNNGSGTTSTSAVNFGGYSLSTGSTNFNGVINGSGNVNITGAVVNGGGSAASSLTYSGAGILTLLGANTYGGATTVSSGTLQLGDGTTGKDGTLASASIVNNANLTYNRFGSTSYGGVISGNGSVTKRGGGTQILTGNNTYLGATLVTNGTLIINGNQSAATGALTVNAGATLGGTGTIGGATTISGIHNPGNSPGIQTFASNLSYTGGASQVNWELKTNTTTNAANPNALFDTMIVGGNLDFTDATLLNLSFVPSGSDVLWGNSLWDASITGTSGWLLYDVAGTTTNFANLTLATINWSDSASNAFDTSRPNSSFSLFQDGNDIYLNYNVIPEPSAIAMLVLGFGLLAGLPRTRRRA